MRYELTDNEWSAITPMLPNKPRGVPRVNGRSSRPVFPFAYAFLWNDSGNVRFDALSGPPHSTTALVGPGTDIHEGE